MQKIKNNIEDIRRRIANACREAGRNDDVTLICVTKTVPPEKILCATECNIDILAENRVQELVRKKPLIDNVKWHLIGHLQTNKVKYAVGNAELIHSVDSLRLAQAIDAEAKKHGICQNILLELNISGEESKYGLTTAQIPTIIKDIKELSGVRFKGFMTMAPKNAPEKELEEIFSEAKRLYDEYKADGAEILSMGMSGDFETAVRMGATHVRIGSAIFK